MRLNEGWVGGWINHSRVYMPHARNMHQKCAFMQVNEICM